MEKYFCVKCKVEMDFTGCFPLTCTSSDIDFSRNDLLTYFTCPSCYYQVGIDMNIPPSDL